MIVIAILVSVFTGLVGYFYGGDGAVFVTYGFIVPVLLIIPRIVFNANRKLKKLVRKNWLSNVEIIVSIIVFLNAPASLFLHDLNFQYDRLLHFSVGILVFPLTLLILFPVIANYRKRVKKGRILVLSFILVFIGLFFWEGFQYATDVVFDTNSFFDGGQDIKIDFLEDIIFGFWGLVFSLIFVSISFNRFLKVLK